MRDFDAYRKTVDTRSGPVGCVDVGEGRTALFVHGVATGARLWRHVIDRVGGERRCVAIDLPLHGRTPARIDQDLSLHGLARLVEDFCAALDLRNVDLVGNDSGGAIAQVFAAQHPERLRTLTLTNCDVQEQTLTEPLRRIAEVVRSGRVPEVGVQSLAEDWRLARDRVLGAGYEHPEALSEESVRAYLTPLLGDLEKGRILQRFLESIDIDGGLKSVEPLLRRLRVPTRIVWGTGDLFFETRAARWLYDTIPGATGVDEVENARLFFPEERPDDLVAPLRRHWAAHTGSLPASVGGGA